MKKQCIARASGLTEDLLHKHQNVSSYHHLCHNQGSYGHCYLDEHGRRHKDSHNDHFQNYQQQSATHNDPHNTFSKLSISSLSSSSSWDSETSVENERYFLQNKPQYSASCSNILEAGNKFCEEMLRFDTNDTALFMTEQKQNQSKLANIEKKDQASKQSLEKSELHRCKSRSVEGLLQSTNQDCNPEVRKRVLLTDFSPVHKTTSLGQNLSFTEKPATASKLLGPKRAVSSFHLSSKGILKNKDEENRQKSFRKAKSMEVLSTNRHSLQNQSSMETHKKNFVKQKLDFSAFLDEITRQVISPSNLNSFRLTTIKPECSKSYDKESRKHYKSMQKGNVFHKSSKHQPMSPHCQTADIKQSNNRKTRSPLEAAHKHLHQQSSKKQHNISKSDEMKSEQREKYNWPFNDDISTNTESVQKEKQHNTRNISRSCKELYSGFTIPDKSLSKESDFPSAVGSKMYKINKHMGYKRHSKNVHRDSISSMERSEFLEHYNKELHKNLLQTVSCIEATEAELESTKAELNRYKDKYKRLQDSYSNLQQDNSLLQQELQSVVENTTLEQTCHLHRISELTKELDAAKTKITLFGNTDIPSLVKELLEKHFNSQDSQTNFLLSLLPSHSDIVQPETSLRQKNKQSSTGITEDNTSIYSWVQKDLAKNQDYEAAYLPWIKSELWIEPENNTDRGKTKASTLQPPEIQIANLYFSAVDPSPAICSKTVDERAKHVKTDQLDFKTELPSVKNMSREKDSVFPEVIRPTVEERGQGCLGYIQEDPNDITCLTAQNIL